MNLPLLCFFAVRPSNFMRNRVKLQRVFQKIWIRPKVTMVMMAAAIHTFRKKTFVKISISSYHFMALCAILKLAKAHEYGGDLRTGCQSLRVKCTIAHSEEYLILNRPRHRIFCPVANTVRVIKSIQ